MTICSTAEPSLRKQPTFCTWMGVNVPKTVLDPGFPLGVADIQSGDIFYVKTKEPRLLGAGGRSEERRWRQLHPPL